MARPLRPSLRIVLNGMHFIVLERYRFGLAGLIGTLKFVSVFVAESIIVQSGEFS